MNIEYEEFRVTIYHTQNKVCIPLLGIRLDKSEFFKKGKYSPELLESKLFELYHDNIKKFE